MACPAKACYCATSSQKDIIPLVRVPHKNFFSGEDQRNTAILILELSFTPLKVTNQREEDIINKRRSLFKRPKYNSINPKTTIDFVPTINLINNSTVYRLMMAAIHSGYHHPLLRKWQCNGTFSTDNLIYPIFVT